MSKKWLILALAIISMLSVTAVSYGATIVGSSHDLRGLTNNATTEICKFCHTPHNASTSLPVVLWNHTATTATYTLYQSATLKGTVSQPSGVSKACLSCHDGTVAVNALQSGTLGTAQFMTGSSLLGTNLQVHHPVSVTYRNDLNSGLTAPTGTSIVKGTISLPLFGTATPFTVECGSCHAVHDPANSPFLRAANTNSQLCLTCHVK